jgi:probable phosphoglycerate mutase
MRQTIYLARHGETDWNRDGRWQGHSDVELNDHGRAQARALAEALAGSGLGRACASDLARARETAHIVARELALGEISVDAGLRERCFGVFEGLTREECRARFPEDWAGYCSELRTMPRGAEATHAVAQRVRDAVLRMAALHQDSRAMLIVSHGAAMRAFLNAITGTTLPPFHNGATFSVELDGGQFYGVVNVR